MWVPQKWTQWGCIPGSLQARKAPCSLWKSRRLFLRRHFRGFGVKTTASHLVFHAGTKTVLTFIYTFQTRQNQSPLCSSELPFFAFFHYHTGFFFFFFYILLLHYEAWNFIKPSCLIYLTSPSAILSPTVSNWFNMSLFFVNYLLLSALECWGKKASPHTHAMFESNSKAEASFARSLTRRRTTDWLLPRSLIHLKESNQWKKAPQVALIKALGDLESNPSLWLGIYGRFIYLSLHHHPPFVQEECWCQWENSLSFSSLQLCFDGAIHPALIPSLPVTASWISSVGRHTFLLTFGGHRDSQYQRRYLRTTAGEATVRSCLQHSRQNDVNTSFGLRAVMYS